MQAIILLGIVLVALVSTLGDYVWYEFGVRHRVAVGILHGAVLLMAVGGVVGLAARRVAAGLPIGAAAGIGGAIAYYVIDMVARGGVAMMAAWAICWLLLAVGEGRLLQWPQRPWSEVVVRGGLAAILGGLSFYVVVNILWGRPPAGGRNYLVQFAAWTFAWAPGILALVAGRSQAQGPRP
jgi:uncharacterized membrane protein (UPF0136 family)